MTTRTLDPVDPATEPPVDCCDNPTYGTTTLDHEGNTLDATFTCESCGHEFTEAYLLRYVERQSDGHRWGRGDTPTCDCEQSAREGDHFEEVRRYKPSSKTAIAEAKCGWCGTRFEDVHKFQLVR